MLKLLSPVCNTQLFNNSGLMLSGGTITVYLADSLVLATIYANSAGGALPNPITLNSVGRIPNGQLYLDAGTKYDILVKLGTTVLESYTQVSGIVDSNAASYGSTITRIIPVSTPTNTFPLGQTVEDVSFLSVYLNGLILTPASDYTISGTNLVTATNLSAGDELNIQIRRSVGGATTVTAIQGGTTTVSIVVSVAGSTFPLGQTPTDITFVSPYLNGLILTPNIDYSLSGADLITTAPLSVGDELVVQIRQGISEVVGVNILTGVGTPLGIVSAGVGSLYINTTGGAGATLWVKESGTDSTGWVAK